MKKSFIASVRPACPTSKTYPNELRKCWDINILDIMRKMSNNKLYKCALSGVKSCLEYQARYSCRHARVHEVLGFACNHRLHCSGIWGREEDLNDGMTICLPITILDLMKEKVNDTKL